MPFCFEKRRRQSLFQSMRNLKLRAVELAVRADNFIPGVTDADADNRYHGENNIWVRQAFGLGVAEYADDGGVEAEEKFVGLMAAVAG